MYLILLYIVVLIDLVAGSDAGSNAVVGLSATAVDEWSVMLEDHFVAKNAEHSGCGMVGRQGGEGHEGSDSTRHMRDFSLASLVTPSVTPASASSR